MLRTIGLSVLSLTLAIPTSADDPGQVLVRAIAAMGGEAALRNLSALHLETIGHEYYIEQSERPEGPFIVNYLATIEDRDIAHGRSRIDLQQRSIQSPSWSAPRTTIYDGETVATTAGGRFAAVGFRGADTVQRVELAPERVLLLARGAADVAAAPDVEQQGVLQHAIAFTWKGQRVRLLINAHDDLLTAVELTRPDEWGVWGDVTDTTYYSLWTLLPGGVRYPLQLDRTWNGIDVGSTTIVQVKPGSPIDASQYAIPADVKAAFAKQPKSVATAGVLDVEHRRIEVAPDVVQYAGNWNVEVVRQPDGLVVIEAPMGSGYSVQVLDELSRRYPGAKVKAVVTTSDAWPHLGGLREYVARGIPVYALDLNRPIIERLMKADYRSAPDALEKAPRTGRYVWVSSKTTIGAGDGRIELYPAREENGERQMFVYLPALKLLYTSDEIQPLRSGGFFMPEYLQEVQDVIAREGLRVDRIFGMHAPPTPWSAIDAALAAVKASGLRQ